MASGGGVHLEATLLDSCKSFSYCDRGAARRAGHPQRHALLCCEACPPGRCSQTRHVHLLPPVCSRLRCLSSQESAAKNGIQVQGSLILC
jgi:hypothetical protein